MYEGCLKLYSWEMARCDDVMQRLLHRQWIMEQVWDTDNTHSDFTGILAQLMDSLLDLIFSVKPTALSDWLHFTSKSQSTLNNWNLKSNW